MQVQTDQETLRGQEKGRGNPFEAGSRGLFQRTGEGDGTSLPEGDRSVSTRLREEAQEADDEVGGVARVAYPLQKPCLVPRHAILHLATLPRLSTVPQNHLNPEGSF